jgi:Fur family peroxide stress response transcriptional regulator
VHRGAEEQEVAERLRQAGLKLTAQRLAIVRCIVGDETHPTAQELFDRLKPSFPTMSFATVYNTLAALTSVGACQPVQFGGPTRFDPNVQPHDHFVCERCGFVRDVKATHAPVLEGSAVEDASDGARAQPIPDVQVHRVERIYRGLCASCRDARE